MSHPMNHARQHKVEKSRVGHLTRHYATGGAVKHSDEAEDRKLIRSMVKKADLKADGGKAKHRMDKPHRAKGGRVGKKGNAKTIINVITGGHPAAGAVPPGPPMTASPSMGIAPAGMAPPPMAARPPMPGPGMPPPSGPPMPMRAKGGRVHRPHGSPVFNESVREGTQVQHDPGKNDLKDMGRGKPVTFKSGGRVRSFYARGGKVEASDKIEAASKLPGGSGGGKARLAKEHRAERDYARPAK